MIKIRFLCFQRLLQKTIALLLYYTFSIFSFVSFESILFRFQNILDVWWSDRNWNNLCNILCSFANFSDRFLFFPTFVILARLENAFSIRKILKKKNELKNEGQRALLF